MFLHTLGRFLPDATGCYGSVAACRQEQKTDNYKRISSIGRDSKSNVLSLDLPEGSCALGAHSTIR